MLSIILPSYNEEDNILNTEHQLSLLMEREGIAYELVFVNDGSADRTYELIMQCSERNPNVRGISFSRNFGKEACIFAGLRASEGDCCVVMDCDLQHPPETVVEMYHLWEQGYEVVEGVKRSRGKESLFYKMSAGVFYKLMSRFVGIDMEASSDFKLLDRKVVDVLCALPEKSTFFRALSFWVGFKTTVVEYDVAPRAYGSTKWSLKKLVKYAINSMTSFTSAPLQIITFLGCVLLIASLVLGIQTLVRWGMGNSVEGFTTVILLILLIGGGIMVSLGIIGHYISKIYDEVKDRPQYIITAVTDREKSSANH